MGATRVGKTLGNFRILECLGTGGAGMIWKAEDLSLGRVVALKALRPELAGDGDMSERFRVEARTLAKLSHANVASLYSLIEDDDEGLFLVLEYVEGNTLAGLLTTTGRLPLDSAFALFHQVLDGVGHAHEAGIVHRDLKPSNLMVDARGRVKVMDFGIARMAGAERTTHHGKLVGTPEYMSPEQVRGEDATIRSDIYSLGIVLFEMLTGQPPFRAASSFAVMRSQLEDSPPDPRSLRPELRDGVARTLLRALAKSPADRFGGARELQDALLDAGASRRGRAVRPIWREVPPASAASEASTPVARAPKAAETARDASSAADTAVANRAPQAAEASAAAAPDSEAAAGAGDTEVHTEARGQPAQTVVIDASQETSLLEPARPTRMIDDAPFAAHARSLSRGARGRFPAGRWEPARLLWAIATAALVALAVGAVRVRSTVASKTQEQGAARSEPVAPRAGSAPTPPIESAGASAATAAAPAPESSPLQGEQPKAAAPREASPRTAAATGVPPETPPEESGWVIRR